MDAKADGKIEGTMVRFERGVDPAAHGSFIDLLLEE